MRKNVFIDLHVLETVPPSCVNRDDTGSPKTAVYGGTVRARVSSQCWKHAVRESFKRMLPEGDVGLRTKHVYKLLTQAILARDPQAKADKLAEEALKLAEISLKEEKKAKEGEKKTDALFFISKGQIDELAKLAVNKKLEKKACQTALKTAPAVDIALFGRMVADDPSLNFDATAQVAHAISTHTIHNEYDYFTAVDDCAPEDNAGAGHLGTVEYNSATLYRYATIHVTELQQRYLGERTPEAVRAFIEAFIRSMPTGKINTFANNVLPNAVYVTIRCDQPANLVGAFEEPVQAGNGGYVKASVNALVRHAKSVYHDFLGEPERAFAIGNGMEPLAETMSLSELLDAVENAVKEIGGQA